MTAHSKRDALPRKPRKDFPLFVHQTGRWAKKIRGKLRYFGSTRTDPNGQAALALWLEQKDELLAGREPRPKSAAGPTMADAANHFLAAKKRLVASGEITQQTFDGYYNLCEFLVAQLGRHRLLTDITPTDFGALRGAMLERWPAPSTMKVRVIQVRMVFQHAWESDLLASPVRFGPEFQLPKNHVLRRARLAKGEQLYTPEQIRRLLAVEPERFATAKAIVLMAINCGMGQTDLATMPSEAVDLKRGWVNYPRPKTGVQRRCPLWPETIEAIKRTDPKPGRTLFLQANGRDHERQAIRREFESLCGVAGVSGRTFYDFRRTFQTIAENSRDMPAVSHIMGHATRDMAGVYRQRMADERLQAVVDVVRQWLFGEEVRRG